MTNRTFKTGVSRYQPSLLPPRLEDYVAGDNPVRVIEAFVGALDLRKLGFRHAGSSGGAGQPPYDPGDLLKLYLYGYLNRIRSSRSLEREAGRNLELIWLMKHLVPGYRTIAKFRQENWKALKAVNREFVLMLRELGLMGGEVVAIDGAFFDGNASKASIKTQRKLAKRLTEIEQEIEAYGAALEANDSAEAERPPAGRDGGSDGGGDVAQKVAALMAKRASLQADLARLEEAAATQLSRTDADARLLSKNGQVVAGYNVQIAVDDKHKLIAASEVVNDGNDTGQLYDMAKAAKDELGVETLTALADTGYYNGNTLKACEEAGSWPTLRRPSEPRGSKRKIASAMKRLPTRRRRTSIAVLPAGRCARRRDARPTVIGSRSGMSVASPIATPARYARAASQPRRRHAPSTAGNMKRCWIGIANG